ncbi:MAG TPA: DPP IV N-terminal domain-containing protein [Vicinamibacterales bacterium]|nr:DPP IV N-terminal domain-containing protein [Vicinamibacterales bacterium]
MTRALLTIMLLLLAAGGSAQTRTLSLDDIYDPVRRIDFAGGAPTGLAWVSETHYVWARPSTAGQVEWVKVDAVSGSSEPLFDAQKMRAAFAALPGLKADDVARLPNDRGLEMNPARTAVLLSIADDLYYYLFGSERAFRLTFDPSPEEEFSFSPDGRQAAFVRRNNLHVVNVEEQRQERQLTTSGTNELLNGKLDWIYQEEIYGRGSFRGYWWSPDSTQLAFLQLDERPVPEFTVVDHIPARLTVETTDYPKPGDPNPLVKLGVIAAVGGDVRWVDLGKYGSSEILIVNVAWTPDSSRVVYQVQNREQFWLDVNIAVTAGQAPNTIFRETTKAWVDPIGAPVWLKDGSFIWISDRSGYRHVYRYTRTADSGELKVTQLTRGDWDLRTFHGVDESNGWIYFSAAERSPIGIDVYRARLDGTGMARVSQRAGTHRANFSPGLSHYIDNWSDLHTPPQVRVHRADGSEVRLLHESKIPQLTEFKLSKPELLQVKTRDGFVMEAMLIRPVDFNPSRQYPVMQFTYGAPGASSVRNAWGGPLGMYYQMLAQRGIAVWVCDNRLASGKGAQSQWPSYKNFGELELRDVEDGLNYLKAQPWVDGARIGIDGWSFGGFMVTYALTHSKSFAMGIGGGNVTDWGLYDSIYTERFMLMPANNVEGYRKSSVLAAAKDLHGDLLLIHGGIDDNVHAQNTLKFAYELQKAGKPFRMMIYEKSRHGFTDPDLIKHLRQTMFDFTVETLKPK